MWVGIAICVKCRSVLTAGLIRSDGSTKSRDAQSELIGYDDEAEQGAGPNDEERCEPNVPGRESLARSSSSVSFPFGDVQCGLGLDVLNRRPRRERRGGLPSLFASFPSVDLREFISLMGADFFSCISRVPRLHFAAQRHRRAPLRFWAD